MNYYPSSADSLTLTQNRVLKNTYWLLALSLLPTMIGAVIGVQMNFAFMQGSPIMSLLILMAGMYGMMYLIEKNRNSAAGVFLLLGFTLFMGVLLGPLLQRTLGLQNGAQLIFMAAGSTSLVFFAMATIATTIKRELVGLGKFLTVGAFALLGAMVLNIFLQLPLFHLMICGAFSIFSSLMILYQIHSIVRGGEDNYISATLTLYISIYNLFTSLLQIFMAFGGDRD